MKKLLVLFATGLVCIGLSNSAQANLLANGGFDEDIGLSGSAWSVYDNIPGWTKEAGTAGIEVQRSTIVPADSYAQYVELDSNGGIDTNSAMFQSVFLDVGTYSLDWMYHARTNNGDDDNGIKVYVADSSDINIYADSISKTYNEQQPDIWEQVSGTFTVNTADTYKVWFAAFGLDNTLGGFVDSVSLAPVPEPASMLLLGIGLASIAGLRRKKR